MLLGEYRQAMDSMGQVVLPNQVLSELRGTLVVARGFERNLILYSEQQWRDLAAKLMGKPISDHAVRTLRRRLFSDAAELSVNGDGLITLPASLRKFAGIQNEVILTGMYDHLELWSVQEWSQILQTVVEQDPNGEQWDGLGL
jgi:MraZ protein